MKRSHAVVFAVVIAATLALALGTGSFTALNAERNVDIATTNDDSAYLGISYDASSDELQLTNNFETPLTVTNIETPASITAGNAPDELSVDAFTTVSLSCSSTAESTSATGPVTVDADGEGVSVEVTQEVTVDCETATSTPTSTMSTAS